jgi:hypothetical protein
LKKYRRLYHTLQINAEVRASTIETQCRKACDFNRLGRVITGSEVVGA